MYSDTAKNIDPNLPDGLGAEARRYLQAIKHELHCPRARKALFLVWPEDIWGGFGGYSAISCGVFHNIFCRLSGK